MQEFFRNLTPLEERVCGHVGLDLGFATRSLGGIGGGNRNQKDDPKRRHAANQERLVRKFVAAKALAWVISEQEVPERTRQTLGLDPPTVAGFQEAAARTASAVAAFCESFGWEDLQVLLAKLQERISGGCQADVLALTTIPGVKARVCVVPCLLVPCHH